MAIEDFKRWHWIVIGAILGIALALASAMSGGNTDRVQSSDPAEFERDLVFQDDKSKKPLISGILIHPAEYSPVTGGNANLVSFKRLATDKKGRYWWKDKYFVARVPYAPSIQGRVSAVPSLTIRAYLQALAKQHNFIDYSYGWWMVPANAVIVGAIGGIVLIGGVWPTLLNLMLGAGLGRKREEGVTIIGGWGLWRYKSTSSGKSTTARPKVTDADQHRLEEVTGAYERSAAAMLGAGASATSERPAPAAVQKLNTQALQEAPKQGEDDETELKYKEYYPVVIHHQKHHDEHKPGEEKKK